MEWERGVTPTICDQAFQGVGYRFSEIFSPLNFGIWRQGSGSKSHTRSRSNAVTGGKEMLEQLPEIGESSTFGCELDFVCRNSQQKLVDPIWHTLRDCNSFTLVVSPCLEKAEHKGQMQGEAKALRVPFDSIDSFFFCTGKDAVCAERHKSPEMNSINGVSRYEPDPERHTNQSPPNKTQHAPKQANSTKHQTRTGQAHVRSSCEPQKMMIRRPGNRVKRGNELVFLAALSSECPS